MLRLLRVGFLLIAEFVQVKLQAAHLSFTQETPRKDVLDGLTGREREPAEVVNLNAWLANPDRKYNAVNGDRENGLVCHADGQFALWRYRAQQKFDRYWYKSEEGKIGWLPTKRDKKGKLVQPVAWKLLNFDKVIALPKAV